MALGAISHWTNARTIAVSVVLAFVFGYLLTMRPLLRAGIGVPAALRLALAADTLSIAIMEVIDNAVMVLVPGAMDAHLSSPRFWVSLIASLILAGAAAFPVNRWLIRRGRGHAAAHAHHERGTAAGEEHARRLAGSPGAREAHRHPHR